MSVDGRRILAALLLALCVPCACARSADDVRPNVVLVSIDSLRPDHLGAYGYSRPTSPHLDRLASEGVTFEQAFSVTSWTLPAHLSLLSGRYPDDHGVVDFHKRLGEGVALLPEVLAHRGYRSAAIVSGPLLHSRFGYARGWIDYDDRLVPIENVPPASEAAHSQVTSESIHERALAQLDRLQPGPFLLFLHYFDVHYDYRPPAPWDTAFDPDYSGEVDGRNVTRWVRNSFAGGPPLEGDDLEHLVALYDGEIRWVDRWIGALDEELRRRGLAENTIWIVTADHGEEFYEHSFLGHFVNLFDTSLRVPLLIRLPDRRFAGQRSTTPVSLIDLFPTIASATGARVPDDLTGRDLLPSGESWSEPAPARLYAELRGRTKALLRGHWKLVGTTSGGRLRADQLLLVNRADDPGELRNLALEDRRWTAELFLELRRLSDELAERGRRHPPADRERSEALERQLRSLGYL